MESKNVLGIVIEKNALVDEGQGLIRVKGKLTLTDNSKQRNGTRYDIESLSIDEYDGTLFANHGDIYGDYRIETVIGKLVNVEKKSNKITADGIQYALSNPLGKMTYDMTKEGFLNSFSIGTMGDQPDEDGVYRDHKIFEISQVGIPNNANAKINQVAINSLTEAKRQGLDTSGLEKMLNVHITTEENTMFKTIKNSRSFAVTVSYKNASGEDQETVLEPGKSVDVSEDQAEAVQKQLDQAAEPAVETNKLVAEAIKNATGPLFEKIDEMQKAFANAQAKSPEFRPADKTAADAKNMHYLELHAAQINAFRVGDHGKLAELNKVNLEALQKANVVRNTMTIEDMGNFVISPELVTEIQGCRNNYSDFVNAFNWRETLSLTTSWLERSGDIDMQAVEMCDDGEDGNLKPVSEYSATPRSAQMEELAAVTPVCNAATRFLAADLLGDVAQGYRNDYDRKRAQLIVAKAELAVESNGNSQPYNFLPSTDNAKDALISWFDTEAQITDCTPNGIWIMNSKTLIELKKQLILAGGTDMLNSVFFRGDDGVPTVNGHRYLVVPSDLMPTLNTGETKTFVVNGASVVVNHAVFYMAPENFSGRISGGLMYDLSREAAYESGGSVKSAFQRNEIVLRGSFYRNGFIGDSEQVAGLRAPSLS